MIDESFITSYITNTFENVESAVILGYMFFFYRDDQMHAFATIASNGNKYERVSKLDRPGVYRLNIGISRETFRAMFGKVRSMSVLTISPPWIRSCPTPIIHRSISSVCCRRAKRRLKESAPYLRKLMTSL